MSGLGFPTRFLVPSEMKNAMANDRARPIQPAFHSQSLRRSNEVLDIFSWVGPTPMNKAIRKMMTAGAINETTTSTAVEIFSLMTHGKLMVGSARSNGRLLGVMSEKAAPTPAIALGACQHWHSFFGHIRTDMMMTQSRTYDSTRRTEVRDCMIALLSVFFRTRKEGKRFYDPNNTSQGKLERQETSGPRDKILEKSPSFSLGRRDAKASWWQTQHQWTWKCVQLSPTPQPQRIKLRIATTAFHT